MVCGPGLYRPDATKKSSAMKSYFQILDAILPSDPALNMSSLWHNDLHEENIFVNSKNPTEIVGIIDWQSVNLLPLFEHTLDPAFVQYSGPKPETLDRPKLEDTSGMSKEEQAAVNRKYFDKALFIASRKIASKKTPAAYRAIEYQKTTAFDLLTIARHIFEFGEAHFHALLVELREHWSELLTIEHSASSRPFPNDCDNTRLAEIKLDFENATRGMEVMNNFKAQLGPLWPDKDVVTHGQYHEAKAALRKLKAELIRKFAKSEADKMEIELFWPFDD